VSEELSFSAEGQINNICKVIDSALRLAVQRSAILTTVHVDEYVTVNIQMTASTDRALLIRIEGLL
jgi:hypothetical protein